MKALYYTLLVAFLSSLLATILGTMAAVGIDRMSKFNRKIVLNLTNLPIINPDIVTGVSLMILFVFLFNVLNGGSLGFATLLLSHIAFNVPYVIFNVSPKLRQMDVRLYEAALDLGCNEKQAFFKVVLPEIMPVIALDTTATLAAPPVWFPATANASFMK